MLTILFTEEKGMSTFEKDPESWSSIPTYDLPFCLDNTVKNVNLLNYIK